MIIPVIILSSPRRVSEKMGKDFSLLLSLAFRAINAASLKYLRNSVSFVSYFIVSSSCTEHVAVPVCVCVGGVGGYCQRVYRLQCWIFVALLGLKTNSMIMS